MTPGDAPNPNPEPTGEDPGLADAATDHRPSWMPRSVFHESLAEGSTPASPGGATSTALPATGSPGTGSPGRMTTTLTAPPPPPPPLSPFGASAAGASAEFSASSLASYPTTSSPSTSAPPSPPREPTATQRAARWVVPVAILAALALFAGGTMVGWALSERESEQASAVADRVNTPSQVDGDLVPGDATEPVAAVAEAVAPSVVQINTDFGLGSGVVMDREGHILTAAHVVEGATAVQVRLPDGTMFEGTVIGTHAETDVGVVKIPSSDALVPAILGVDTDVRVGQMAVAVGSPFGLDQSVTSGIVSAVDRPINTEETRLVGMIQTDASINPGNSGGALADRYGHVIGINDAIRTQGGGNEGIGFAIPIDLAAGVADLLIKGEPVQMGFLGVVASSVFEGRAGASVREVTPGTAAEAAGVVPGDLIVSINGQPVRDLNDLRARVFTIRPGSEVSLVVVRDGEEIELTASIGAFEQ